MIERYTEKAIKVILFAQEEAFMAKHGKLYPEHLLLGIVRDGSGLSSKLLKASGIKVDTLRQLIQDKQLRSYENDKPSESMSFSGEVKKIIREAWYEVQSHGTYYVTPENLFLSLLREKNSPVVTLLNELDVNIEKIQTSVAKVSNKSVKSFVHPEENSQSTNISAGRFDKTILNEEKELEKMMDIAGKKLNQAGYEAYGTEQLVQGILEDQESPISQLLAAEGVTPEAFLEKLQQKDSRQEEYNENEPELTPKGYRAVSSAHDIAKGLGSAYIKPEHVLLGILRENKGIACSIFRELGVNVNELYHKIIVPIEKEKPEILTILRLAEEEARGIEQNIVGTEQILLGILGESTGIGAKVLRNLGITIKDVRAEIHKIIGHSNHYSENKEMVFTPRAKRIIATAWQKARKIGKQKFTSEHLLLAITGEKESIAMRVLEDLGVDTLEIRQGILNELKKSSDLVNIDGEFE